MAPPSQELEPPTNPGRFMTDSRPMQYRIAQIIAQAVGRDEATAEVAIVYAVERDG